MKRFNILILLITVLFAACTEEKTYILDGYVGNNVKFTAVNLSVGSGDFANSMKYNGYTGSEGERENSVIILDYYNNEWSDINNSGVYEVSLYAENTLWTGGYNEIQFTFTPSSPQETSAKFTMPDGTVYEVTKDNPSFVWTVTSDSYDRYVMAESEYTVNSTTYVNRGYIMLDLDPNMFYDRNDDKWYMGYWGDGVKIYGNVDFTVTNMTVGTDDYAVSTRDTGYEDWIGERDVLLNIDIYELNSDSETELYSSKEVNLNYTNRLWACGDNEIRVAFQPKNENEEMNLILPNGITMTLTPTDSVVTFTIDRDFVENCYDWNGSWLTVRAESCYSLDGVFYYVNSGYVVIELDDTLVYDKSRSVWLYNEWLSGTRSFIKQSHAADRK